MKRFLIGSLAVVGALTLLFMVAGVGLLLLAATARPQVPERLVLELELDGPLPEYVSADSLTGSLGDEPTTVRDVVDALEKAGTDPRVRALVLRLGGSPGSLAQAQELRDAVKAFRKTGKKAVVYADSFGEGGAGTLEYYLASAFDDIYVQPTGLLSVMGLALETPFARDAYAKLGVKPRFGQRHEYKNAVNSYTEQGLNAPHREALEHLLGGLFGQVVRGIAEDRELAEDAVRAAVDNAPLTASQALEAGLVDALLYRDEAYAKVRKEAGEGAQLLYVHKYLERAGRPHERGATVALIYGTGAVMRGRSNSNPLTGETSMGAETVALALRRAVDDTRVKAILFRVDSPGGSHVASDAIRHEVQRAREKGKPVIVSMTTYAASGGYFVAMDADKLVAQPGTLTGSIGVYSGKLVTDGFWEKLGVNWETVGVGRNATMYSTDQDFTPEQRARFEADLDRIYEDFTTRVAKARELPLERVQQMARGRVWTGEDALERGLVDALGGFPVALKLAREAAKLPPEAPVRVEVFPRKKDAAELLAELLGGRAGDSSEDEGARVAVRMPLEPVLEQVRALHQLGARLGLVRQRTGVLTAPLPETAW